MKLLKIFVYNFILVFVYDFFDNVPEGVIDALWKGVEFYDCFYDLGLDWTVEFVLFNIEGELVGRDDFIPMFFFNYIIYTSSCC